MLTHLWTVIDMISVHHVQFIYVQIEFFQLLNSSNSSMYSQHRVASILYNFAYLRWLFLTFLQYCMECRRGLAMRILSICPSVKRVDCDKSEEKSVQIFVPCERSFSLVFWEEEWLVVVTPSTWNLWSTGPSWNKIADFEQIIAHSTSAIRPSKKAQLTLIGSPLHAFQRATCFPTSVRWSYISPKSPKGGSKTQNGRFPSKIALRLKKVCYKVYLCENCQRQSCSHSLP